jgi:peptidyl-prolyl cis-trans isomerase D
MRRLSILLLVPLALLAAACGGGGGKSSGGNVDKQDAAVVGDEHITRDTLDRRLQQAKCSYDLQKRPFPKAGSPEYLAVSQQILQSLVQRAELAQKAPGLGVTVTDAQVEKQLKQIKKQYFGGSEKRYNAELKKQCVTDAEVRADVRANVLSDAIYKKVTAGSKVTDADVKAYYDAHKQEFQVPEKVKLQYVMLNMESAMGQVTVSADDVKAEYEKRIKQQQSTEERRASHILVAVPASATPEQKQKAKEKAEGLLKQAQAAPKNFAELAKKNSEDPGSAVEGGDLGFTPRGRMVKPFEDAMFAMKVGDIVGPIETQFGYHIIKLTDVKAAQVPTLESLKPQIEQDLKKTAAQKIFAKQVEDFSNLVYDQPDSLKPVLEKFKLTPQTTGWVSRQGGDMPLLTNEKLMRSIFSESVLRKHQNTEAVEVAPNIIVAARVTEHEDAKERPLDDVKAQIAELLTQQKAAETAQKQGQATLEKLRKGEDAGLKWSAAQMVTRESREGLSPDAAQAVFSTDPAKLPGFVGVEAPGGRYVVYRVSKVVDVPSVDPEQRKQLAKQLEPLAGQESYAVRVQSLRQNADVKVDEKKIADKGSAS